MKEQKPFGDFVLDCPFVIGLLFRGHELESTR